MTPQLRFLSLLAVGTYLCLSHLAHASQPYPDVVKQEWNLPGPAPDCILCHQSDEGGANTVTKPFGRSLLTFGATGGSNTGALRAALDELKSTGTDSDGDGVSDYDELIAGTDPNDGPGAFGDFPIPQTGCSLSRSPSAFGSERVGWFFGWGMAVAAWYARGRFERRRRQHARR